MIFRRESAREIRARESDRDEGGMTEPANARGLFDPTGTLGITAAFQTSDCVLVSRKLLWLW